MMDHFFSWLDLQIRNFLFGGRRVDDYGTVNNFFPGIIFHNQSKNMFGHHKLKLRRDDMADYGNANLKKEQMANSSLVFTNFTNVNLEEADLSSSNLECALFFGANLKHANFSESYLGCSDLSHSDLSYADLRGANLGSAHVEGTTFKNAYFDAQTILPFSKETALSKGMIFQE